LISSNPEWNYENEKVEAICNGFCKFIISEVKMDNTIILTNFLKFSRYIKDGKYALKVAIMTRMRNEFEQLEVAVE
jgi:nucleoid DNA-binding protein